MQALLVAVLSAVAFLVAYHTYGRWLGSRIFRLSAEAICPSVAFNDGKDFVPTPRSVVFGHHFTSIAGTGPIVGPAIAVMWGWLPALLWVIFGSIFIGAVHDLGALVVSLRNRGQTVGDIAGRVMNGRVRILFLCVLFLCLTIVLAVFGLVIASVFQFYPSAIFPCTVQIPIAVAIGWWLHRRGQSLLVPSLIALVLMYLTVVFGDVGILGTVNAAMARWPLWVWVVLLLLYSYIASVLPVWVLLQPRDYINSLQLISALGLILVGLIAAAFVGGAPPVEGAARPPLEIVAPVVNWSPSGAPAMLPFLFITIACGAISGFHCLVSSGTSSKQLRSESDARFVGYGAMMTEGFLAVLVILACTAGLGLGNPSPAMLAVAPAEPIVGRQAFELQYTTWQSAAGLRHTVGAFVNGAGNFVAALGIPASVATALMGVLVASFAGTTMDTACRLQRYVIQELASAIATAPDGSPRAGAPMVSWLRNAHGASLFAIVTAGAMAAIPPAGEAWSLAGAGKGGMLLWPLFGATNQLLGGLAFMVILFYLWRRGGIIWFLVVPMAFMLVMPAWAMLSELPVWIDRQRWVLVGVAVATLLLELWMIVEAALMFPRVRNVLEGEDGPQGFVALPASPEQGAGG